MIKRFRKYLDENIGIAGLVVLMLLLLGSIAFGSSSGSVGGGDADTVDGYNTSTGADANTIPIRDSNGSLIGNITGIANSSTSIANTIADQNGGANLKVWTIEIGDWNMDTQASKTVTDVSSPIAATYKTKVRSVSAYIRADTSLGEAASLTLANNSGTDLNGIKVGGSSIYLYRETGGYFDGNADYDDTSYNRGWIIVWYTE